MILLIIAMVIYYLLIYFAIRESDCFGSLKSITNKEIIINMLMIFVAIAIAYSQNIRENYIYYWDHSTYWIKSLEAMKICTGSLKEAIKRIVETIYFDDYNLLQGMLMAIPLKMLGNKYLSFILVIFIQFLIPSSIIVTLAINKLIEKYGLRKIKSYYILGGCLFFVWFWEPALSGYADMAAVLMVSACILVTFSMDFSAFSPRKDVLIAFLLLASMLLRRYFAYWVVGYSVGIFLLALLQLKRQGKNQLITSALVICKNFLLIYSFIIGILVVFFKPFLIRSLFNNYSVAYQAYNTSDFINKVIELFRYLGIIYTIPIICIISYSLCKKKFFEEIIFLFISSCISILAFYRTQNMGIQHYYIISVQIIILIILGISFWTFESWKISRLFVLVGAIGYVMNFGHGISLLPEYLQRSVAWSDNFYKPKQRGDMDEIQLLKKYLKDVTPKYEGVYVIGSSVIMTSDVLSCSYLPNLNPEVNIVGASQVDLRDGFYTSFLEAKVIVCATPAQYHLSPDAQRVTGILTEEFENRDSIISDNFSLVNTFSLDNKVRVNVYIKKSDFTVKEVEYLADKFDVYYSAYPELFRDRFNDFIHTIEK